MIKNSGACSVSMIQIRYIYTGLHIYTDIYTQAIQSMVLVTGVRHLSTIAALRVTLMKKDVGERTIRKHLITKLGRKFGNRDQMASRRGQSKNLDRQLKPGTAWSIRDERSP